MGSEKMKVEREEKRYTGEMKEIEGKGREEINWWVLRWKWKGERGEDRL